MELKVQDFQKWSPVRIFEQNGELSVDWIFLGDKRFIEPFHGDTIRSLVQKPFNLMFRRQTPFEFLGEIFDRSKGVAPRGFIFHASRCGSTLISQMLAAASRNIVVSEAAVIDSLIRADLRAEKKITGLRWLLNALAQKRFAEEDFFFVKFDCWNILDLPLIEQAFPDVPWIFLYRNPVEVIESNLRQPGVQMIPGAIPQIFPRLSLTEILQFSVEERYARIVAVFYEAALANPTSERGKFIDYSQLPDAVTDQIFTHFNLRFAAKEVEAMRAKTVFHAKNPQLIFSSDTESKRRASETARYFAEKIAVPLYEKLKSKT